MVVVFDFDGTIANGWELKCRGLNLILPALGIRQVRQEEFNWFRDAGIGEATKKAAQEGIGILKIISIAKKVQEYVEVHLEETKLYPGVAKLLGELAQAGVRLGVVSANKKENVERFLEIQKLSKCFEFVDCQRNILGKSRQLQQAVKNYKLIARSTVYVGDQIGDIEAAHKLGIKVIAVGWGYNSKKLLAKSKPDWVIERPEEIRKIVFESGI